MVILLWLATLRLFAKGKNKILPIMEISASLPMMDLLLVGLVQDKFWILKKQTHIGKILKLLYSAQNAIVQFPKVFCLTKILESKLTSLFCRLILYLLPTPNWKYH